MERESFEDREIAELLNRHFISVKVDREERPDVDSVYMSVCRTMTGSGGWPLSIVMTPERKPFYAGTYLPKNVLMRLVPQISDLWKNEKRSLIKTGEKIEDHLVHGYERVINKTAVLSGDTALKAVETFAASFDGEYGGFGSAPKFPAAHNLLFLLEYDRACGDERAAKMVKKTLTSMYRGGIFDHIAGGFSRYSTDDKWLVPHFEKMLYDNALLARVYLEAYELYQKEYYKTAAQKIFSWVFAELTHNENGFFCGQDADSEGVEGKYYLFSHEEIEEVLGEENATAYRKYYGITKRGNFEGKSIPNLLKNKRHLDNPDDELILEYNRKMYGYRRGRYSLHTDDKVLTSWNALMMTALVKAYEILGDVSYLEAAQKCDIFISEKMSFAGRLYVRWKDGEVQGNGKLDDYANYALALLDMYSATADINYLKKATHYADVMAERFFDYGDGGFFLYANDDERLITRPKEIFDNALPSGNSTAFMILDRLFKETGDERWSDMYKKQSEFIASYAEYYPTGCCFSLITVLRNGL